MVCMNLLTHMAHLQHVKISVLGVLSVSKYSLDCLMSIIVAYETSLNKTKTNMYQVSFFY